MDFKLISDFKPTGDQPSAIEQLVKGVEANETHQTLLGVTGSGKTFTVANLINQVQKPTLILSHNKTLAAQLYSEFKQFSLRMLWNTSFLIMIIISQKLTFQVQEPTLKKTFQLTKKLKNYV